MNTFLSRHAPIVAFLILAFLLTLFIYKDFGIAWDEQRERKSGALAAIYINSKLNYIFISKEGVKQRLSDQEDKAVTIIKNNIDYSDPENYLQYDDKDYGVVFTLILTFAEVVFSPETSENVYYLRHLIINIFFLLNLIFLYQILWIRFKDWRLALLGPLFLILSPVIFAHSYFNPKDIPFMSAYIFGIYTLLLFLQKKNFLYALLHGLACAILIDIRIPGIILPALTLGFLMVDILFDIKNISLSYLKKLLLVTLTYVGVMLLFVVAFWPYLWTAPLDNFITAYSNMKKFRWNGEVLFFGDFFEVTKHMPWYYIPGWIIVNTPILYLACFAIAILAIVKKLFVEKLNYYKTEDGKFNLVVLATFLMPILAIIILNSILYNGWRQVYFIYPSFVIISICGVYYSHQYFKQKTFIIARFIVPAVVTLCCIGVSVKMYLIHPFQSSYFNILAGSNIEERFEVDYWGLSFRKNLEYIVNTDKRDSIKIGVDIDNITPAKVNSLSLSEENKKRISFVEGDVSQADYLITKYDKARSRKEFIRQRNISETSEVFNVTVGGIKLSSTFKLKP